MLAATTLDPTLLAAAVVTVIAAMGGVTVQIINSVSAAKDRREAAAERKALFEQGQVAARASEENSKKSDELIKSTTEIHTLTNSTNSNLQKALEVKTQELSGIKALLAQMIEEKHTTAAVRIVTDAQKDAALLTAPPAHQAPIQPQSVTVTGAETILASIDENTAAIEKNTAKTDATVQELKEQKPKP